MNNTAKIVNIKKLICLVFIIIGFIIIGKISYGIIKYKTYIWIPSYINYLIEDKEMSVNDKHLIFVMVDHYEPGVGVRANKFNQEWLKEFTKIAIKHKDTYGNVFRYTWFYPYDHKNDNVLISLCEMAYNGFGEVEMHWHHPPATTKSFPGMLEEAIRWFQQYGALISFESLPRTHFAFIHGNWALDNSLPKCGVDNELAILFGQGCYADFTFSTIGTKAQPKKINSIYYAFDNGRPKSYDNGEDIAVGKIVNDKIMIFEGPLLYTFPTFGLEYGAIESYATPNHDRINRWIDANIHVKGRPEWIFVKVYSHGAQSKSIILDKYLDSMLTEIEDIARLKNISLHYMTAREAYNVIKAAEDGREGNPENFRDFVIPKPVNTMIYTKIPLTNTEIIWKITEMLHKKEHFSTK